MRTQTRSFVSALGVGIIGVSYYVGAQAAANDLQVTSKASAATPLPSATEIATATPTPTATTPAKTTTTKKKTTSAKKKTSDSVAYRYGQVTLTVTRESGKITAVDYGNSSATDGRAAAFPTLVQAAIDSNGSDFGNLGGATFTTSAFKTALENALAKF